MISGGLNGKWAHFIFVAEKEGVMVNGNSMGTTKMINTQTAILVFMKNSHILFSASVRNPQLFHPVSKGAGVDVQ